MGAILAKIGSLLMKGIAPFLPYVFDWLYTKVATWIKEWRQKRQDDKRVDGSAGKVVNGELKEGLEGTDELQDELNRDV